MGMLILIIKKSWSFIAVGFIIMIMVFMINYSPLFKYLPTLQEIRDALNPSIPIIAALLIGIFAQGIGMIYKLFEEAIKNHLEKLKEVTQALINEKEKFPYFSDLGVLRIADVHKLHLYIKAPYPCDHYKNIKSKYGNLVEDIGNHWPKAGEIINKVRRLCINIEHHNNEIKKLEGDLLKFIKSLVQNNKAIRRLSGLNFENFEAIIWYLLIYIVRSIVEGGFIRTRHLEN